MSYDKLMPLVLQLLGKKKKGGGGGGIIDDINC